MFEQTKSTIEKMKKAGFDRIDFSVKTKRTNAGNCQETTIKLTTSGKKKALSLVNEILETGMSLQLISMPGVTIIKINPNQHLEYGKFQAIDLQGTKQAEYTNFPAWVNR